MNRPLIPDSEYISREKFLNTLAETYLLQDAILSSTELSVISVTPDGIITSFNTAAEKMLGYNHQELIGKSTPMIIHDWDELVERANELTQELGRSIEPGFDVFKARVDLLKVADRREWTYITKTGYRFPVMLSISGIWNDKNEIIGYLGIATDITEQKKTDQIIRQSEAHLQALLNSIDDIAFEVNDKGVYTNIWTKNEHLLFINRDIFVGKNIYEVLQGPLAHLLVPYENAIKRVFEYKQPVSIEYEVPDERPWRSGKISFINDSAVLILVRDITDSKLAEQKIRDSEQKFRMLAENIPGVIYLCRNDANFTTLYLNNRVQEVTGFSAAEFVRNEIDFVQLYHPEDKDAIFAKVEDALARHHPFHLEYRLRHKDGHWIWIEEFGSGVYHENELILLEGFLSDITSRKKAEEALLLSKSNLEIAAEELQEQNRQLNEFAHIISHNLRSPVGNINALISLLNEKSSIEDFKEIFERLKHTSVNLQETLNDLMETLHVKKTAAGVRSLQQFADVFAKIKQDLAGELLQNNTELTAAFYAHEIYYSKTYLESIMLNLLSNALKYRSPQREPRIHFETTHTAKGIVLRVNDNGLGIDMHRHGHELFGLRKTFHEHKDAKGVGLFLTRTQVEASGGKIWIESEVNKGTTVFVLF